MSIEEQRSCDDIADETLEYYEEVVDPAIMKAKLFRTIGYTSYATYTQNQYLNMSKEFYKCWRGE